MKANVRGPGRRGDDLDGLRAAYLASTRDGHSAWCVCGVELHVDSDGTGRLVEYEYRGGTNPGFYVHRCRGAKVSQPETPPQPQTRHGSPLNSDQVREIRSLRGILTCKQLGEMYGIAPSTISGIWTGNTWGGVE